jgi:uncharacterized protein (DUF2132 family)
VGIVNTEVRFKKENSEESVNFAVTCMSSNPSMFLCPFFLTRKHWDRDEIECIFIIAMVNIGPIQLV